MTRDASTSGEIHYPEAFVERLHMRWGRGFLSPGGPEEVRAIVAGLDLAGRRMLDLGCGTGGPAIVLAGETGARVLGVDIERPLLERATGHAAEAGVAVDWQLVEPGPLPFPEGTFDVVFSKDALIHIPDKSALFAEIFRVLKPGGVLAASDWLAGEGADRMPAMQRYLALSHLDFALATAAETEALMRAAGLVAVTTRDRNAWYAALARRELAEMEQRRAELAGDDVEAFDHWLLRVRTNAEAAAEGSLRPTHLRGTKPK